MLKFVAFVLIRTIAIPLLYLGLAQISTAQDPLSGDQFLASRADARFDSVTEDLTTPGLSTSHLKAIPPLAMVDRSHAEYTVELFQMQWRLGDEIDVYVMKPTGVKKPPVILYLLGYPSDTETFRDPSFQSEVTKDGFAAVCFLSALTGHRYHSRPMKEWFISELQESFGKSAHDVQMVLNYLAGRGDLDMDRVGMFGQTSGASIGILASAVDPRIKVLDILDPWGDWPTWMAKSPFVPEAERPDYVKPEFLQKAAAFEPVDWLPKVQAKKLRFQDAVFETHTPKSSKEKLRAAAPAGTTFVFYKDESEFDAAFPSNRLNLSWIKQQLQLLPSWEAPANVVLSSRNGSVNKGDK